MKILWIRSVPDPAPSDVVVHLGALPRLTAADRCDACPRGVSRAYVGVRLKASGRRLYFCGHHYARHLAALAPLVDSVRDQREDIPR